MLKQNLLNSNILEMEEFEKSETTKSSGVTFGFIKHISNGENKGTYMFKPIVKSEEIIEKEGPKYRQDEDAEKIERAGALVEYTFGGVFQTILKDQAPVIGLAVDRQNNEIFMTSKFLNNAIHIDTFCTNNKEKLANNEIEIEGLEKAVIASLYCGDTDLNPGNLLVKTE
ncbi:MAG TPA: hypothetical protein LFW21_02300 [Rickettsia endosymbiont of Pyrocoelia pectoralis]|nr:hypothetical protein [Rickettsia endosymbiont of Pyrocoelia pectoralis]